MHTIIFSLFIAALTVLAIIGCIRKVRVIDAIQMIILDLASIKKDSVFPEIASKLDSIPSYVRIGVMGYCTPDTCVRRNFGKFNLEDILAGAVLQNNNLTSTAVSAVNVVLPTNYSSKISYINKLVDAFSIMLLAWFCIAVILAVCRFLQLVTANMWLFSFLSAAVRSLCFTVGITCASIATAGIYFASKEFNKNESDSLGIKLLIGSNFLALLWAAVLCSLLDAFVSMVRRIYSSRKRIVEEEPVLHNKWGYKI